MVRDGDVLAKKRAKYVGVLAKKRRMKVDVGEKNARTRKWAMAGYLNHSLAESVAKGTMLLWHLSHAQYAVLRAEPDDRHVCQRLDQCAKRNQSPGTTRPFWTMRWS